MKKKRNRNTTCPECEESFFSRKLRHHHQMTHHRGPKVMTVRMTKTARRAKPLYAAVSYPL